MSDPDAIERARQSLPSAEILLDAGHYEDSVSRSFYAMFYLARGMLRQEEIETKTHSGLVNQFGLRFVKEGDLDAGYGRSLREAEEVRQLAEYADEIGVISEEDARATLKDAQRFIEDLAHHLRE